MELLFASVAVLGGRWHSFMTTTVEFERMNSLINHTLSTDPVTCEIVSLHQTSDV